MKMSKERYQLLKDGIVKVLDYYSVKQWKEKYKDLSDTRFLFDLMWKVQNNLQYDDIHPHFLSGTWHRIIPYTGVNLWKDGDTELNNDHMATALRRIGRELNLVRKEWK